VYHRKYENPVLNVKNYFFTVEEEEMPTKLHRYCISVPDDLLEPLRRECLKKRRPVAALVVSLLVERYAGGKLIFGRSRQPQEELSQRSAPVFGSSVPPDLERVSARHASLGKGRS
jgi:hypothetical protein